MPQPGRAQLVASRAGGNGMPGASRKAKSRVQDKTYGARLLLTLGALTCTFIGWIGFAQSTESGYVEPPDIGEISASMPVQTTQFAMPALPTVVPLVGFTRVVRKSIGGASFDSRTPDRISPVTGPRLAASGAI